MHKLTQFVLVVLLASFSASGAFASVLTVSPGAKEVEGVKISTEARARVSDRSYNLKPVGAGLRYKKVAFIHAKVYVGEFLVDAPEKISKTAAGALGSIAAEKAVAMRMTFLRDVDGEKVSNGFKDALEENKVKLDSPAIKNFLDAVRAGGEAKDKKTFIVVGEHLPGGKEAVSYENAAGKLVTINGEAGFVRDIFSMWLGKIDDSGLENLKNEILGIKD